MDEELEKAWAAWEEALGENFGHETARGFYIAGWKDRERHEQALRQQEAEDK